MAKIIVLGSGLVGSVMAKDLSNQHDVTVADISNKSLEKLPKNINKICEDLSKESALEILIKDYDIVVGALPGFMGYRAMERVIKCGKNIVDISFYSEDPFGLDKLAKENKVVAVMDCGVAPGMGNIIFSHHDRSMEIKDYECLVGGLPKVRMLEGGMPEIDYRESGGFVPVGKKEKADDVPAMLSKNEFVMTADAVRGMGDGNVEKGAQRMYDQMKQLENRVA